MVYTETLWPDFSGDAGWQGHQTPIKRAGEEKIFECKEMQGLD